MEVDSDSEQPSGSGTVSKDKKRCVPVFHYYQAYKWIQSYLWRHFDRNEFVSNFCLALNMKQFFVFLQIWGEEMECCGSLGLGHCCRQLCNLQVSLNLIEFCSCYSETYRNHTVAPHTLSQNSILYNGQEPHHGPVHWVPGQPGFGHQWGVHCGLGNVSLIPRTVFVWKFTHRFYIRGARE